MKAAGTWAAKISGVNVRITISNGEAECIADGGHQSGGTCEDVGDLLAIVANAVASAERQG
jgi:hypothetical protein